MLPPIAEGPLTVRMLPPKYKGASCLVTQYMHRATCGSVTALKLQPPDRQLAALHKPRTHKDSQGIIPARSWDGEGGRRRNKWTRKSLKLDR